MVGLFLAPPLYTIAFITQYKNALDFTHYAIKAINPTNPTIIRIAPTYAKAIDVSSIIDLIDIIL